MFKSLDRRLVRLLGGTALVLAMQSPAFAAIRDPRAADATAPIDQTASATSGRREAARDDDDIIVTGHKKTIRQAQKEQLENRSLVTIVSGDELRAQPQQNLADLLTRLPGVSSAVDQRYNAAATGEAQYVTIRGLDSSYNAYQFDGVRLAQTDGGNRAISMNLLSPFALAEVRVDKAPTAAQDGDAIAGVIDMRTASPFHLPAHHFQIRTQGQISGRAAARGQQYPGGIAQIETAQRFGSVGIYASGYYGKKNVYSEATTMHKDYIPYNKAVTGPMRDNLDNAFGRGVSWNVYQNTIERLGGTVNLEWKTDGVDLYSRTTYGEYRLKSWMDQTAIRLVDLSADQINRNPGKGAYDANGFAAIYGTGASNYFRTEHSVQRLFTTKLGGEAQVDDRVSIDAYGAYSWGKTEYPFRLQAKYQTPAYIGGSNTGTATFRLVTRATDPVAPHVLLDSAAATYLTNPANFREVYSIVQFEHAREGKGEAAVNLTYKFADTRLTSLRAGAKYERAHRESNGIGEALEYDFSGNDVPTMDKAPGTRVTDYMHGGAQVPFFIYDHDYIEGQARRVSHGQLATADPDLLRQQSLAGTERRAGAYLLATIATGGLEVVPGVRFEHNRFAAEYWQREYDKSGTVGHPASSAKSYDIWLPSLIASYRPDDSTVYRASVRKGYTRPPFGLLVGPTALTYDISTIDGKPVRKLVGVSVPNPDLKATQAWNIDASVEYAGAATDFASAALFYKRLRNIWFATSTDTTLANVNAPGDDGVVVSSNDSDGKGSVYGIELFGRYTLKHLPGAFDGLGVQGNLTLQRADATVAITDTLRAERRMTQAPQVLFNAELFYDHGPVTGALSYNYSGNKIISIRNPQPDTYLQPTSVMNLSLGYSIGRVTVGGAIQNLLNSHVFWATYGERKALLSVDRSGGYIEAGRTYLLNLSYRM